jgi:uncharacterized membrane protein YeiH
MNDTFLLQALDYAGVATFAASGALVAAHRKHDVLTFVFFAAITGIGGGTLRDVLMGVPVFWLGEPGYLTVAAVVGCIVWLVGAGPVWSAKALLWLDAVGLAAYATLGADKALGLGHSGATAVVMGVLTGTFGGILRDVLAGEPSVLLRREIYVTAALVSAATFVLLRLFAPLPPATAMIVAVAAGFCLRAGAIRFGWSLPQHGGSPGRS